MVKFRLKDISWICLVTLIVVTACSSAASTGTISPGTSTVAIDGATMVAERCTACHSISRVEGARFSATEWKTVVDTMIAKGAQLTPDEESIVVKYLAANYGQ